MFLHVLLAYDVYSSLHFLSVFVESVDHHNRGLDFILLKPLSGTTERLFYQHHVLEYRLIIFRLRSPSTKSHEEVPLRPNMTTRGNMSADVPLKWHF